MLKRLCVVALAALTVALPACGGGIFGKQYEYEEDLTITLDGSGSVVVNASLPSLAALRGLPVPTDPNSRISRDEIRKLYTTPVTQVTRVSREWRRKGRRFVQVRVRFADIRKLHEAAPFSWSRYSFTQEGEKHNETHNDKRNETHSEKHVYTQKVGGSAMQPGSLKNYGWDGSEVVAFRLHLPSEILWHNARDLETNATRSVDRGNILAWEQQLADRLEGRPLDIHVDMESRSILNTTLWLFGGAFAAAVLVLVLFVWWAFTKGRHDNSQFPPPTP